MPRNKKGGNNLPEKPEIYQIDINNNNIYFNNKITAESVAELCNHLRTMDEKITRMKENYKIEEILPIYLHLSSDGGHILAALSAFDAISLTKNPVYTVIDGYVSSAGTFLSLAGKKCYIKPNAFVYLHELKTVIWGRMTEMNIELGNNEKLMDHVIKIYIKKTKFTEQKLREILKKNSTYNAKSAIEYGIAQEIYK